LVLALISFVLGAWAYVGDDPKHVADGIFKSLQMFHLHFHPLGAPAAAEEDESGTVPTNLQIARFGAAVVALGLLPAVLVLALFRADLSRSWVKWFWRRHVIVCGRGSPALSLVRDLCLQKPKPRVVFIGHCHAPQVDLPSGVLYLESDAHDANLLAQAAVQRAESLVALQDDDRANLEILVAAGKLCANRNRDKRLECHAHLADAHLQIGLHKLLGDTLAKSEQVRFHLFNYYEIVARNLAFHYPLPDALAEKQALSEHYIIVGFGPFGQNVALKLVKMGQQLVHRQADGTDEWQVVKPRVTVIDPRGERATAAFLRSHPAFQEHCTWSLQTWSCEDSEFLDLNFLSAAEAGAKHSLIFCLEDETLSLRTALLLQDICRTAPPARTLQAIYLRLAKPERLGGILANLTAQRHHPPLTFFAPDKEIFSADAILRYGLDTLAQAVHEAYLESAKADARANNKPTAVGQQWEDLGENDRDSNREAADHTWAKLRTLGYDIRSVPTNETVPPISDEVLADLKSHEEELARVEHYRWMIWRLLTGWTYGSPRDNQKKQHPDLVAYEKLASSTQDKDKIVIRAIPELLSRGRLQVVKRRED
jgi:voltage-gated potassium channel Kch